MNFIPLTREEKRRLQQKIKDKQDNLKLDILPTHDNHSPIPESDGATTDRQKVTRLKQVKKEETAVEPLVIQDNFVQSHPVLVQPSLQQHIVHEQPHIPQFNNTKQNAIAQPSPEANLQQDQNDKHQIQFENQEQQMSPKKSVRLKRDLGEVLDYAKPVQGYGLIQFIQSQYSPQQNKQNDNDRLISQQLPVSYQRKSSKRALNNSLRNVGSEKKSLTVIEPTEQNVLAFSRKSYRRNLSPNLLTQEDHKQDIQKINSASLKINEQGIFNHIAASQNVETQPLEERIDSYNPQRLSRNLNSKSVFSYRDAENKDPPVSDKPLIPLQQKKQPISIQLNQISLNEIIEGGNRKSMLKRNLQKTLPQKKQPISVGLNELSLSEIAEAGSQKSLLKRNLENSTIYKREVIHISQPIVVNQMFEQIIVRGNSSKRSTRNLSKNINSSPKQNEPLQIKTSHRINDEQILSQKSNSSDITQGWNNQKQIFKVFKLQSAKNRQNHIVNASANLIRKPLNSLHLK